jgi:hypothetical protein
VPLLGGDFHPASTRLSRNVGQPDHIANPIISHKAERRPGPGEIWLADTITGRTGQTTQVSKATWSGNTLVITTTRPTGEHKRTFNLESGNLIVEASTSGFGPMPTKIIYKKAT